MLNIKQIRQDPSLIEKKLQSKDPQASLKEILSLDEKTRQLKSSVEGLKSKRNDASKAIGLLLREGKKEEAHAMKESVAGTSEEIRQMDQELAQVEEQLQDRMARLPNLPGDEIPVSHDPQENVSIKEWGKKPSFSFSPKNHLQLNEALQILDFERGAKIGGTGWPVYKNWGARLEWALINYMLEIHLKNGFTQWIPPLLARPHVLYGSSNLPKFEDQLFKIRDEDYNLYLIPTAEVVLNGLHAEEILDSSLLPMKYVAYTPCFRREAGAAGSNERGLIRVHQFNKVEMFAFSRPEESEALFQEMLASAEEILQGLGMHYRNALLVTGDMSFAAAKTIDIEVWLPGQDRYYEVSSVSNCTDFQARRSKTRYRSEEGKPEFVHTLNGSGLATARLMVALLENNQNEDGSVTLPEVLRKYLGGKERLEPEEMNS